MKDAEIIVFEREYNEEITNIIILEALDITAWVKPGHLILTSYFALQHSTPEEIDALVAMLVSYHAAGIIIKKQRLVKEIPTPLIESCQKHKLPLISIPKNTPYTDIQVEVMEQLFNKKAELLNHYYNVHNSFTRFSLDHPTILEVLHYLEKLVSSPVSVLNTYKNVLFTTQDAHYKLVFGSPLEQKVNVYFEHEIYLEVNSGKAYLLIVIPVMKESKSYYLCVEMANLTAKDFMVIENAVSFLQMQIIHRLAVHNIKQRYINDVIDDLLAEKFKRAYEFDSLIKKLKLNVIAPYYHVISAKFFNEIGAVMKGDFLNDFCDHLKTYWLGSFYRLREDEVTLILPNNNLEYEEFKFAFQEVCNNILSLITKKEIKYFVGISDKSTMNSLANPYEQSKIILKKIGTENKSSIISNSNDISFYKFFSHIANDLELVDLVPEKLKYLYKNHNDLFITLKNYLDCNQQLKLTANKLDLHTKTIKYRIDRIISITNINFNNPEEVFHYNMGFRVLELVDIK